MYLLVASKCVDCRGVTCTDSCSSAISDSNTFADQYEPQNFRKPLRVGVDLIALKLSLVPFFGVQYGDSNGGPSNQWV